MRNRVADTETRTAGGRKDKRGKAGDVSPEFKLNPFPTEAKVSARNTKSLFLCVSKIFKDETIETMDDSVPDRLFLA